MFDTAPMFFFKTREAAEAFILTLDAADDGERHVVETNGTTFFVALYAGDDRIMVL